MSYFDDDLIKYLNVNNIKYVKLSGGDHDKISSEVQKKFKFIGSQIAWASMENATNLNGVDRSKALNIIAKKLKDLSIENVLFLGDSAIDYAYCINVSYVNKAMQIFSEIPQHTYVLSEDFCWIACISAEGYIDYADFSPKR